MTPFRRKPLRPIVVCMNSAHPAMNMASNVVDVVQAPTGVWYLAGTFPVEIGYVRKDGAPMDAATARACAQVGPRLAGCQLRTWATREAAVEVIRSLGWQGK